MNTKKILFLTIVTLLTCITSLSAEQILIFPDTCIGSTSTGTLIISNDTPTSYSFQSITSVYPPFRVLGETCSQGLGPYGSCIIDIEFSPTGSSQSVFNGCIAFRNNNTSYYTPFGIIGTGVACGDSYLTVSPNPSYFEGCIRNDTKPVDITLTNNGSNNFTATILGISLPSNFRLYSDECSGKSLKTGQKCTIRVYYIPLAAGTTQYEGSIALSTTSGDFTKIIQLIGKGDICLTANVPVLDYGPVLTGTSVSRTLQIYNSNAIPINNVTLSLTESSFTITNAGTCQGTIPPKSSCTVEITFTPNKAGQITGSLFFYSSGQYAGEVALSGEGVDGTVSIMVDGKSSNKLDFGKTIPNSGITKQVVVKNTTKVPLYISRLTTTTSYQTSGDSILNTQAPIKTSQDMLAGDAFKIIDDTCSNTALASQAMCTAGIKFEASQPGKYNGTLKVEGENNNLLGFILISGEATPMDVSISPTSYDYGLVEVGKSKSKSFNITLSSPAFINSVSTTSRNFVITSDSCSLRQVGPSQGCSVEVTFLPDAPGGYSADLIVSATFTNTTEGTSTEITERAILSGSGQSNDTPISSNVGGTVSFVVNFGEIALGQTSTPKDIQIINVSSENIEMVGAIKTSGNTNDFIVVYDGCQNITLAPNQRCTVTVAFQPNDVNKREMVLGVKPKYYASLNFTLIGVGLDSKIEISPTFRQFKVDMAIPNNCEIFTFQVKSVGNIPATITGVSLEKGNQGFSILEDQCNGKVLPVGALCNITVKFVPPSVDNKFTDKLIVTSNSVRTPSVHASLEGIGYLYPDVLFEYQSPHNVIRGRWADHWVPITIKSTGDTALAIQNLRITKGSSAEKLCNLDYSTCGSNNISLLPGQQCNVQVICFGSDSQVEVRLTGETNIKHKSVKFPVIVFKALYPEIKLQKPLFGIVEKGQAVTRTGKVINIGSYPFTVTSLKIVHQSPFDLFQITSDGCTNQELSPGMSCEFAVLFATQQDVSASALLRVDASSYGAFQVTIYPNEEAPIYTGWKSELITASTPSPPNTPGGGGGGGGGGGTTSPTQCSFTMCKTYYENRLPDGQCPTHSEEEKCTLTGGTWKDGKCECTQQIIVPPHAQVDITASPLDFGEVCIHTPSRTAESVIINNSEFKIDLLKGGIYSWRVPLTQTPQTSPYVFLALTKLPIGNPGSDWYLISARYLGGDCTGELLPQQSCRTLWQVVPEDVRRYPAANPLNMGVLYFVGGRFLDPNYGYSQVEVLGGGNISIIYGDVRTYVSPNDEYPDKMTDTWSARIASNGGKSEWSYGDPKLIRTFTDRKYEFPVTLIGDHSENTFYLRNRGSGVVTIGQIAPLSYTSNFLLSDDTCSGTQLSPFNGSCSFKITAMPTFIGTAYGSFNIPWSDCSGSYGGVLSVSVEGDVVILDVSPAKRDYGEVLAQSIAEHFEPNYQFPVQTFTGRVIKNNTKAVGNSLKIKVGNIFLTDSAFRITEDSCSNAVLAINDSCNFKVQFIPTKGNLYNGFAVVPSNDPITPVKTVSLTGKGVAPRFYPLAPVVTFPKIPVGEETEPFRLYVKNIGTYSLKIYLTELTDPVNFDIKADTCNNANIAPNNTCYVDVTFRPSVEYEYMSGLLLFYTNDPEHGVSPVYLESGNEESNVVLNIQPTSIDFGEVNVGEISESKTVTAFLTGLREGMANIQSIQITNQGDFSIVSSTCGDKLIVGEQCTIELVFHPQASGWTSTRQGQLLVTTTAGEGIVNLQGSTGIPSINIAGETQFEGEYNGPDVVHTFTVTNTGTGILKISSKSLMNTPFFRIDNDGCTNISLKKNESCQFNVTMLTQMVQQQRERVKTDLVVASNDPAQPETRVTLTGHVGVPDILVQPTSIYKDCSADEPCYAGFIISNRGDGRLVINNIIGKDINVSFFKDDKGLNSISFPSIIEPGNSLEVYVRFTPSGFGIYKGKIGIDSNDLDIPLLYIDAVFNILSPNIQVIPLLLDFGTINVGQKTSAAVQIINNGGSSLNVAISTPRNNAFSLEYMPGHENGQFILPPKGYETFTVYFNPTYIGHFEDKIIVSSNDPDNPVIEVIVKGDTNIIEPHNGIQILPVQIDFGEVSVGETSSRFTFTVLNLFSRTIDLNWILSNVLSEGPFVVLDTLPNTLNPLQGVELEVVFIPPQVGEYIGTIVAEEPITKASAGLTLKGKGIQSSPIINVEPEYISFGNQQVGTTSSIKYVIVSNVGGGYLTINSYNIQSSDFNIVEDECTGKSLQFGETCKFGIVFAPTQMGEKNTILTVMSSAHHGKNTVTLEGTGVDGSLSVSPTSINFGIVPKGALSPSYFINIINNGPGYATVRNISLSTSSQKAGVLMGYNGCIGRLEPGEGCQIEVYQICNTTGTWIGNISISTSSTITPSLTVTLTGRGTRSNECPEGSIYSVVDNKCISIPNTSCPSGQNYSPSLGKCVAPVEIGCPEGYIKINSVCQQTRICPPNTLLVVDASGSQLCYRYVEEPECPSGFTKMVLSNKTILCYSDVTTL